MTPPDAFLSSMIARPAFHRLLGALAVLAALWLAILWAVALP
ncbi:hypothetical protein [Consotaella aegiceratis]